MIDKANSASRNYWNQRWINQETGWDIGVASPAIVEYFQGVADKNIKILIPGCGNAHEAEFLLSEGFTDISLVDISQEACSILKKKFKENKQIKVYCEDFFAHEGKYNFIIEQTFFCAISSELRSRYTKKTSDLLLNHGRIIGALFNRDFGENGPPFGGSPAEYRTTFEPYYEIFTMENCRNSIPQRTGEELFINLIKKGDVSSI